MNRIAVKREPARAQTGLLFSLLLSAAFCSCQKVVSIDINQSNPQVDIQGVLTDGTGPYQVVVSQTGDYFTPSLYFPPVSNALVTISDNLGLTETLKEGPAGTYVSSTIQGVPERTYHLRVVAGGKEYDAVSTMPEKVRIDSLYATPYREFDGDRAYTVYVMFKDPPTPGNYYRLDFHTNVLTLDSLTNRRFVLYSDRLTNGLETTFQLRQGGRNVHAGDTLTVRLFSLDKATYDYFNTVNDILTSDRSPVALAPANPNTNLSNGSLGYFAAYTLDSSRIVLP